MMPVAGAKPSSPPEGLGDEEGGDGSVCVVGAGAAGLATAKHLRASGFGVVIYESRDGIGGVWYFDEGAVGVSLNTRATSSRAYLEFSDFPMPPETPDFVSHTVYRRYLQRYAEEHQLLSSLRLNHRVTRISPEGSAWRVSVSSPAGLEERRFRAVAVCSGLHHVPLDLEVPGQGLFRGRIVHSSLLKNVEELRGRRVMVVGVGESGADMAHEVAGVAGQCFLSVRRGVPVLARQGEAGRPADYDASRAKTWLPVAYLHDYYKRFQQSSAFGFFYNLLEFLILLLALPLRPSWFSEVRRHWRRIRKRDFWRSPFRGAQRHGPASGVELSRACREICQGPAPTARGRVRRAMALLRAFEWYSGGLHFAQPFTKSEEFLLDVADGKVAVVPGVSRLIGPAGVELQDRSTVEVDCLLLSTGFRTELPFLPGGPTDGRALFKGVFAPEHGRTLAFIGFCRPGIGALPPLAEMQSRWFAAVLSGRCRLPSGETMRSTAAADGATYNSARPNHHERLTSLVDYHVYLDTLAGYLGCRPRLMPLLLRPRLLWSVIFGPFTSHQYRLFGPEACPDVAAEVLTSPGFLPSPGLWALSPAILFFVVKPLFFCLSRLGLRRFRSRY